MRALNNKSVRLASESCKEDPYNMRIDRVVWRDMSSLLAVVHVDECEIGLYRFDDML